MADTQGRTDRMVASVAHVFSWFRDGSWERHHLDPGIADFTFGNPQELPLPGLVDALQRNAVPQDKDWFAYKMSEEEPRSVVAESLRRRTGIAFEAEDIALTDGRVRRARRHDPRAVRRRRRGRSTSRRRGSSTS